MDYFKRRRGRRYQRVMEDEEEYAGEYEGKLFFISYIEKNRLWVRHVFFNVRSCLVNVFFTLQGLCLELLLKIQDNNLKNFPRRIYWYHSLADLIRPVVPLNSNRKP
jgi:hypothetical protein